MPDSFTCITCQVMFKTPELQREHYKQDWHRYNLKRKVASIPPVTLEEFEQRAKEHRELSQNTNQDESQYCKYCSKLFNTKNAYNNHLNSKKHKICEERYIDNVNQEEEHSAPSDSDSFVKVASSGPSNVPNKFVVVNANDSGEEDIETDSDIEELDSDEWEECRIKGSDSLIKPRDCLFCGHHSKNMLKNLKHMSEGHSFFIPDVEYCVNIKDLLLYLGEKISQGFMCLWCNDAGRTFYSMEAARAHMVDKGHCKMLHEGLALAEYAEYYDYSSSYPDQEISASKDGDADMDVDEEVGDPTTLVGDDIQLVLPSGVTVGHRSLMRYYKQNLTHSSHALVKKSDRKLHRLLGVYKALGWAPKEQAIAAKKARDIHFMKRVQAKWQMKLSLKANKFQKHYRPQVNF